MYRARGFGNSRSRSCDSYIQAPNNISLKSSQPVRSSKGNFEIRGRSHSTVSTLKSSLSSVVFDEYQICSTESRESSRIPFTEQNNTSTFALCSTSRIVHSLTENIFKDTQRSSPSPRSGQDIDGKDRRISGYRLDPQGDCVPELNAIFCEISKTGSISDKAESETKDSKRSRDAMQKPGSPCKSDLIADHEESYDACIKKSADEVSNSALQKFNEIFDGCDAEKRFKLDPKRCLLKTRKGQRCGGLILWKHKDMIQEVLASLANLYFKDDEQECIHQLERLADLAVCKRNHRGKARKLINSILRDHGASIVESVMDGTDSLQAGASLGGSSTAETTAKSSKPSFKKEDVIPDDIRKEIQDCAKGRHDDGRINYDFRATRSMTLKKRISYLPKFLPYKPREATKSSATEWLKKQISKPLLPSELASGWLYVYWNRASFGYKKIGFTTKGVDQRLRRWISQCKHEADLQACPERRVPHVRRLEQIVHAEFKDFRFCERNCPGCHRSHKEWFKPPSGVSLAKVIEEWIQWMLTEPYEKVQGVWQLKTHHAERLDELVNLSQVREIQEVKKQLETAVVAKQKRYRTRALSRSEIGRLKAKSKVRQINRALS